MEEELSELITEALKGVSDFEALETLVRNTSLRISAEFLEKMISAETSDTQPIITHPDGTQMKYAGRRDGLLLQF